MHAGPHAAAAAALPLRDICHALLCHVVACHELMRAASHLCGRQGWGPKWAPRPRTPAPSRAACPPARSHAPACVHVYRKAYRMQPQAAATFQQRSRRQRTAPTRLLGRPPAWVSIASPKSMSWSTPCRVNTCRHRQEQVCQPSMLSSSLSGRSCRGSCAPRPGHGRQCQRCGTALLPAVHPYCAPGCQA